MKPQATPSQSGEGPSKPAAKAFASALQGGFWVGLRWWQRLGVVLLWLGAGATFGSLALVGSFPWLFPSALVCMALGGVLLFAGATWARPENWPTHGD